MSILMRVRLVLCGVAMKIPHAQIRHMKIPPQLHADVEHGPDCHYPPPLSLSLDAACAENLPISCVCHDTPK